MPKNRSCPTVTLCTFMSGSNVKIPTFVEIWSHVNTMTCREPRCHMKAICCRRQEVSLPCIPVDLSHFLLCRLDQIPDTVSSHQWWYTGADRAPQIAPGMGPNLDTGSRLRGLVTFAELDWTGCFQPGIHLQTAAGKDRNLAVPLLYCWAVAEHQACSGVVAVVCRV